MDFSYDDGATTTRQDAGWFDNSYNRAIWEHGSAVAFDSDDDGGGSRGGGGDAARDGGGGGAARDGGGGGAAWDGGGGGDGRHDRSSAPRDYGGGGAARYGGGQDDFSESGGGSAAYDDDDDVAPELVPIDQPQVVESTSFEKRHFQTKRLVVDVKLSRNASSLFVLFADRLHLYNLDNQKLYSSAKTARPDKVVNKSYKKATAMQLLPDETGIVVSDERQGWLTDFNNNTTTRLDAGLAQCRYLSDR